MTETEKKYPVWSVKVSDLQRHTPLAFFQDFNACNVSTSIESKTVAHIHCIYLFLGNAAKWHNNNHCNYVQCTVDGDD